MPANKPAFGGIAHVIILMCQDRHAALVLDTVADALEIDAVEVSLPTAERKFVADYLEGQIQSDGDQVYIIDMQRFLKNIFLS